MTRSSLLLAAAALALTACAADPISPAAASREAVVAANRHTSPVAVHGSFAGTETGQFQPATMTVLLTLLGSGNASLLGHYTSESNLTLDIASGTTVGTMTLTTADGSTITSTVTGVGIATNGISRIVETATITGGTGRFAGARGELRIERTLDQASGISSGSISGGVSAGS